MKCLLIIITIIMGLLMIMTQWTIYKMTKEAKLNFSKKEKEVNDETDRNN